MFLDAVVDVFVCDDTLQAIFFQTEEMQQTFAAYLEIIILDATYKLNDLRMPLYVMLTVDGNGESEIVALWIVQTEDRDTLSDSPKLWRHSSVITATGRKYSV